jgi:hypothetical protein
MDERRVIQLITLAFSLTALIIFCYRYIISRTKTTKWILIYPIVFFINTCLFYSYVLIQALFPHLLPVHLDMSSHLWAAGLTLHASITVGVLAYVYTRMHL